MAVYANVEADTYARNLLLGFGFAAWNLGSFTAASTRINDGIGSLESLLTIWARAQDMAVGLNRVFEILDLEPEIRDALDASDIKDIGDGVAFRNVTFGYNRLRPVLSEVNLTTPARSHHRNCWRYRYWEVNANDLAAPTCRPPKR